MRTTWGRAPIISRYDELYDMMDTDPSGNVLKSEFLEFFRQHGPRQGPFSEMSALRYIFACNEWTKINRSVFISVFLLNPHLSFRDFNVAWKSPLQDYVVQDTEGGWHPTRPAQLAALDQLINETGIHKLYTGMTAIGLAQANIIARKGTPYTKNYSASAPTDDNQRPETCHFKIERGDSDSIDIFLQERHQPHAWVMIREVA